MKTMYPKKVKSLTLPKLVRASIRKMDALFNGINNVKFLRVVMECTGAVSMKAIPLFPNLISIELVFPSYSYICWYGVVKLLRHCPKLQILFIKKVFWFAFSFVFSYILINVI